jgi:hypothetical protein
VPDATLHPIELDSPLVVKKAERRLTILIVSLRTMFAVDVYSRDKEVQKERCVIVVLCIVILECEPKLEAYLAPSEDEVSIANETQPEPLKPLRKLVSGAMIVAIRTLFLDRR